jgi:hypothetical protein
MLQTPPLTVKVTCRPEVAVAATVNGGLPYVLFDNALKVIVWFPLAMLNDRATFGAGL